MSKQISLIMASYRVTKNDRNFVETTALHIEIFYTNGGPHSLSAQKSLNILIKHAVTTIFILLLYKRCITETTLLRLLILRGCQRLLPNIWNYSKDKAEGSFIIEKIVRKLLRMEKTRTFLLYQTPARFHSDTEETKPFKLLD